MQRLAEAADVSKRTLYQHFPSKDALIAAYLRQSELDLACPDAVLERPGLQPRERLLAIFDAAQLAGGPAVPPRGCAFLNAAVEIPDPAHPVHQLVREHKRQFARRLAVIAAEAGAREPRTLGEQLALLYDGAASRNAAVASGQASSIARELAQQLIDTQIG